MEKPPFDACFFQLTTPAPGPATQHPIVLLGRRIGSGRVWDAFEALLHGPSLAELPARSIELAWNPAVWGPVNADAVPLPPLQTQTPVVAKVSLPCLRPEMLSKLHGDQESTAEDIARSVRVEADIYTRYLRQLYGTAVPRFGGLYTADVATDGLTTRAELMLLEVVGPPVARSWVDLDPSDK